MKKYLRLFITGFSMGAADLVPGVSGGTIAFIAGIYEELIYSIKKISGEVLKLVLQLKIKEAIKETPLGFLVPLFLGVASAFLFLSRGLAYLLEAHPVYLWSLFFGLILASVWVVKKRVVTWDWWDIGVFAISAIASYLLVGLVPTHTPSTYAFMFLTGAIAICAMILPGVSGSFLLLVMGKYEQILTALVERDIATLALVGLGAVVGLSVFSRIVSYLFERYHDVVVAVLTGFMVGSLRKVWPWKEIITTRINSEGHVVPVVERNILPDSYGSEFLLSIGLAVIGAVLILRLDKLHVVDEHTEDVDPELAKKHARALKGQKH